METFDVNSKIAQKMQNSWNFIVYLDSNEEVANFSDYLGDFILKSGDREVRSKIWSPSDSLGELTAVTSVFKVLVHF